MIIIVDRINVGSPLAANTCSYSVQNTAPCHKAFTNGSPTYLADMMTSCNPVRSTRSSHKVNLLVVPHQKSNKCSEKAFAVVGPRLCNKLLTDEQQRRHFQKEAKNYAL